MKGIGFLMLLWAMDSGTWWLFVLAFLLWQFGGSANLLKALWVEEHFHRD